VPTCPRCDKPLVKQKTPKGLVYTCGRCEGRALALPVLRRVGATPVFLRHVWLRARSEGTAHVMPCPHCGRKMARVRVDGPNEDGVPVDVCTLCRSVWFDPGELKSVAPTPEPAKREKPISPEVRERLARLALRARRDAATGAETTLDTQPAEWWQWIPGVLGLPVETEAPERQVRPYATWVTAGLFVAVFLLTLGNLKEIVGEWGFLPADPGRHAGATLFTSFLLHAGWFHLIANTYFFLVFGDNVEDHLGWWYMLVLLVGSHVAGMLLHGALEFDPTVPVVGASAGICGVLGYYAVTYPWARLGLLFRWYWYFRWFQAPAFVFLILYLALQVLGSVLQTAGVGDVSHLGHLGGLATGIAAALVVRLVRRKRVEEAMAA
jgi:membrane associated rhomboid family serine protease/Zn-finger nucleic acid-binding protein